MKFSWKLVNTFINLKNIELNEFKSNLTLSGLEMESINDDTINLSITTNRKEISSILSFAREISSIFNIPLSVSPIKINNKYRSYIRIIDLQKYLTEKTPQWLLLELEKHEIEKKNIIRNIQKYIYIKWGCTFDIIDSNIAKTSNFSSEIHNNNKILRIIDNILKNKSQIIIFRATPNIKKNIYSSYSLDEFYENMYIDSINLISTIAKIKIGKYHQIYTDNIKAEKTIRITKKKINELLGCINNRYLKFIATTDVINILKQLHLSPQYKRLERSFTVKVPQYRQHDLNRDVDIVEEIGRIYKFYHFFKSINQYNIKGFQSENFLKIKKIRDSLRYLGLHEVINCCLTKNIHNNGIETKIYNPINNEQQELRTNIIENIINNYRYNIKHSKKSIEIFEISKVFEKHNNKYREIRKLGGLVCNNEYTRNNWEEKFYSINLFHFKNIIETFLETVNSIAIIKPISSEYDNNHTNNSKILEHFFKKYNKMGIYDTTNKKLVGIIGELNNKILNYNFENSNKIYIFEIHLNEFMKTIRSNNYLNYTVEKYSNYPNVTRDISIKMKKFITIAKIKQLILNPKDSFIESIEVLNEYKNNTIDISNLIRSVSLRITYRSMDKTLSKEDLKIIDENLENKLKEIIKLN